MAGAPMKCAVVKIGDTVAIVCGSQRRQKKCAECGVNAGTRLCDWKIGKANKPTSDGGLQQAAATCDKPLCGRCARSPAKDKDLCHEHWESFRVWNEGKKTK